jgi:hypothetical protein
MFFTRYSLNGAVNTLNYDFSKALKPAWYKLHLPGGEEENEAEYDDRDPRRNKGIGDLEITHMEHSFRRQYNMRNAYLQTRGH